MKKVEAPTLEEAYEKGTVKGTIDYPHWQSENYWLQESKK